MGERNGTTVSKHALIDHEGGSTPESSNQWPTRVTPRYHVSEQDTLKLLNCQNRPSAKSIIGGTERIGAFYQKARVEALLIRREKKGG